jgi:hypothetical protein
MTFKKFLKFTQLTFTKRNWDKIVSKDPKSYQKIKLNKIIKYLGDVSVDFEDGSHVNMFQV